MSESVLGRRSVGSLVNLVQRQSCGCLGCFSALDGLQTHHHVMKMRVKTSNNQTSCRQSKSKVCLVSGFDEPSRVQVVETCIVLRRFESVKIERVY